MPLYALSVFCGMFLGRQLQNGRVLAFNQRRQECDLSIWKFERIMMHGRLAGVGAGRIARRARQVFPKSGTARSTSTGLSNASSVPGTRQIATLGSPTAVKPRVIELRKLALISLSPIRAGRDATLCRL